MKRRIYVSSPRDEYLDERSNRLKWAIVDKIESLGYEAQVFGSPEGGRGLATRGAWTATDAKEVMSRCVGAAILGFPIWKCSPVKEGTAVALVTEYCHYEGALAKSFGLPILAVLEEGSEERVSFARHGTDPVIRVPIGADETWINSGVFVRFLNRWNGILLNRRDVFLAYSSGVHEVANGIKTILTNLDATVLDWDPDFVSGKTILEQVEEAAALTSGGIFLFTADDKLEGDEEQASPRDNVVFEAGFFANAKGHERILIILEEGTKMPADLGGVVYAKLRDRTNMSGLEQRIRNFIDKAL